jgi:LysM repeat protein
VYCDAHGDALCARCMDPALALPSYRVYRGSLAALLIGSIFAIWLLVLPQAGADRDAPPSSLAGVLPTRAAGTATPVATATVTPTATATEEPDDATATPTGTADDATATPAPTATATATPTAAAPETVQYTVQPGDTLYAIAERFQPPGRTLDQFTSEIQTINGIADPSQLQVGSVIDIPGQ